MAANVNPIYTLTPHVGWGTTITSANTAMDGTGTVSAIFTAGANGSYLSHVRIRAQGTNAATVVRLWLNNGSTNATAANNTMLDELSLLATTASNSQAQPSFAIPLGFAIPASYVVNATIGTAVSAGILVTCIAGDY